jgi:hypothetical protein
MNPWDSVIILDPETPPRSHRLDGLVLPPISSSSFPDDSFTGFFAADREPYFIVESAGLTEFLKDGEPVGSPVQKPFSD